MFEFENAEEKIMSIYQAYYLDVYRFLICFTGNQNEAEDLTQEVFIRVLNNLSSLQRVNNLKTWILSISKHVAIDHYRKKKFLNLFSEGFFSKIVSSDKTPSEQLEQDELKQTIHKEISRMKPHFRAVIILRGINEFSIKETSEILKCSESKVKIDYHRALKELKRKLNIKMEEVFRNA